MMRKAPRSLSHPASSEVAVSGLASAAAFGAVDVVGGGVYPGAVVEATVVGAILGTLFGGVVFGAGTALVMNLAARASASAVCKLVGGHCGKGAIT